MTSNEIRKRFLAFFEKRGHVVIPSASLVPENDPSVLFTTAGMQPLAPYLLGAKHPAGKRIVDVQKCVRTGDIDEVGDNTHDTFFEMLGNWSLGDYFKEETIAWSYEFLTSTEEGLGLDLSRLYVTVFEGDENAPADDESAEIWKKVGVPENRIYSFGAESNWWSPGPNGPCGPDSEMFYDISKEGLGDMTKEEFITADKAQQIVEVWNDVFMEYEKKDGKVVGKLLQKNVDTGAGLERLAMLMQGKDNVFAIDLFAPLMERITKFGRRTSKTIWTSDVQMEKAQRVVADHIRTAVFMIGDGVTPSNTDQGYILRRLLRRAVRYADVLGISEDSLSGLVDVVVKTYEGVYINIEEQSKHIKDVIKAEEEKFRKTLEKGLKQFEKISERDISGKDAFDLYQTYGFPIEITQELAKENGISVDEKSFQEEMKKHKELSQKGAEQKFKGGLADTSEMSVKYHTATHLLHQALREVLGEHATQKGSNITTERLRFDFTHPQKMTDEEKQKVEDLVNEKIDQALPVTFEDLSFDEAKARGAIGLFEDNYGDVVRVYQIGAQDQKFSIELCGGPHVENTSELGHFTIKKEQATSAGVRRIKAVLT